MPLIESQPDALARVYAASLYQLAEEAGGHARLEELAGELDELVELTRKLRDLSEFMASRILGSAEREAAIGKMFKGRVSDLLLNFLLVLNRKERLGELLPIAAAFAEMVQEKLGRVEVDVYTRHELSQDQVRSLQASLARALGREPVVHPYTDPKMIGGIRMQMGDKLIDAGVSTQLRKMKERLVRDGGAEVRTRFDDMFQG